MMSKTRWGLKPSSGNRLPCEDASSELDVPLHRRARSYPDIRLAGMKHQSSTHSPNFLLPVHEDDEDDTPVILTNSPITTPKSTWEHQYGRFLKQSTTRNAIVLNGPPPPETISSRSSSIGSASTPIGISPSDILTGSPKHHGEERSVRGGKLFSGLMFRNSSDPEQQQQLKLRRNQRSSFSSASDELDETKRRGVEKAYSPGNTRFRKQQHQLSEGSSMPRFPLLIPPQLHETAGVVISIETTSSPVRNSVQSSAIKKAFTDFHNTSANTESPYLGDEMSIHNVTRSVLWSRPNNATTAVSNVGCTSILRSVRGVETWMKGRRYLMGPAIYAACHPKSLLHLQAPVVPILDATDLHRDIRLGDCWLCNADDTTKPKWTESHLIVRQKYLLDFETADSTHPRGILHLDFASARLHEHFPDTIYLSCYGSPCAKADPKRLLLRITCTPDQRSIVRERVLDCLNRAANLTLNDVYEISYDKGSTLGESQYVQVRAARKLNEDGSTRQVALKIFDKSKFWKAVVKGQERADTIVREISVQAILSAQCEAASIPIVRIYGFFETTTEIAIELERLKGTDLFQYVSSKNVLTEPEAAKILRDVLTAVDTMSSLGLAHRDIKPANLLMSSSDDQNIGVKVGDFGMSTFVDVDGLVRGRCGTPGYVAPEIFKTTVHGGYSNKVDVFSAGVTLYVCLCGYEPFYGETDEELKEANRRAAVEFPIEEWKHISPSAIDLIQKMMHVDPALRLSAKEALAHEFFNQADAS